jgi:hypothetical protein
MKSATQFDNLDVIEKDIRRRIEKIDLARRVLEAELADFLTSKQSILQLSKKYSGQEVEESPLHEDSFKESARKGGVGELPWGRYAGGVEQVVYVVKEAGARGLGRLEVVDQIETILGKRPSLNSVTTWLNRARKRGQVKNRERRWYSATQPKYLGRTN